MITVSAASDRTCSAEWRAVIGVAALTFTCVVANAASPLSKRAYLNDGATRGVVLFVVDWSLNWRCGGADNAQNQAFSFQRLSAVGDTEDRIDVTPASPLLTKLPKFYAFLVEPGEYALSAFRFKIARSASDVSVVEGNPGQLIVDGKATGGSFNVGAGEIIYVGHFGVDCNGSPQPWRFYMNGREPFDEYVSGVRKEYPFLADAPITFRLFRSPSQAFGLDYELPGDSHAR